MKKELKSTYYNEVYRRGGHLGVYNMEPENVPVYSYLWQIAASAVGDCDEIVDLGCGAGHFSYIFRKKHKDIKYTGYDFSEVAIRMAQNREVVNCDFKVADLYKSKFDKKSKRVFVCLEVLEHLENDIGLISNLPLGSTILFSVPNYDSAGHVRIFENPTAVIERYASVLSIELKDVVKFGKGNKIFLFKGSRI